MSENLLKKQYDEVLSDYAALTGAYRKLQSDLKIAKDALEEIGKTEDGLRMLDVSRNKAQSKCRHYFNVANQALSKIGGGK